MFGYQGKDQGEDQGVGKDEVREEDQLDGDREEDYYIYIFNQK